MEQKFGVARAAFIALRKANLFAVFYPTFKIFILGL